MSQRFFEDFTVGEVQKPSGRVRVEKADIIAFAKQFDPQPFHLDDEAGRKSIFGQLVASGWHTAAMTMRLVAGSEYRAAEGSIGMGFDGPFLSFPAMNCASRAKCWKCGRRSRAPIAVCSKYAREL
jgi:acyl dehydratase